MAAREAADRLTEPARQARNAALHAAVAGGISKYRLAALLGLSRNTVTQIVLDAPPLSETPKRERLERAALHAQRAYAQARRSAAAKAEGARLARNDAIRQAAPALSQREIARIVGLSQQRVAEIVNGARDRPRQGPRQRRLRRALGR